MRCPTHEWWRAVTATSAIYLLNQDWLHAVVYSDYVGFAYLGYLALASALLADVVFNRARATTMAPTVACDAQFGVRSF